MLALLGGDDRARGHWVGAGRRRMGGLRLGGAVRPACGRLAARGRRAARSRSRSTTAPTPRQRLGCWGSWPRAASGPRSSSSASAPRGTPTWCAPSGTLDTRSGITRGTTGTRGSCRRSAPRREITEGARILEDILGRLAAPVPASLGHRQRGVAGDGAPARPADGALVGPARRASARAPRPFSSASRARLRDGAIVDLHDAPGLPGAPERLWPRCPAPRRPGRARLQPRSRRRRAPRRGRRAASRADGSTSSRAPVPPRVVSIRENSWADPPSAT